MSPVASRSLLTDFLSTETPLTGLAAFHNLTLPQLRAWLESPETQEALEAHKKLAQVRAFHQRADAESAAISALRTIAATYPDEEITRKAACALLRITIHREPPTRPRPGGTSGSPRRVRSTAHASPQDRAARAPDARTPTSAPKPRLASLLSSLFGPSSAGGMPSPGSAGAGMGSGNTPDLPDGAAPNTTAGASPRHLPGSTRAVPTHAAPTANRPRNDPPAIALTQRAGAANGAAPSNNATPKPTRSRVWDDNQSTPRYPPVPSAANPPARARSPTP